MGNHVKSLFSLWGKSSSKSANNSASTSTKPQEMCDSNWESVLNSRILANHFKDLCDSFLPPYKETNSWINRLKVECNNNMILFLNQLHRLIKEDKVDEKTFINEVKKIKRLNIIKVEILWYLEFFKLMSLSEFIQFHESQNNQEVIQHIARQIFETMLDYKSNQSEIRKIILMSYLRTILECSKCSFFQVQLNIIIENLKGFYEDSYIVEKNLEISNLTELLDQLKVNNDLVKLFFQYILSALLEGSYQSVKSIIRKQQSVKNNIKDKKICQFFKSMVKYCDVKCMTEQVQVFLLETTRNYNWDYMLCFITFIGMHYKDGWSSLKTVLNVIIKECFQNLNEKLLLHAFLLARQGCFEKSNTFPSYMNWFSSTFSSESKRPLDSKRKCNFFFNFLTEVLPYETAYHLKVHINKVPWVPSDCQSILHEYTELVKVQLSDLNVSVELGICENMTNKSAPVYDVENVLNHFERTNDILKSVFQASMFWKDYYEKKFLAELLSKFEGKKSVRHKFILKLHSLGKIPNSMFKVYKSLETKSK